MHDLCLLTPMVCVCAQPMTWCFVYIYFLIHLFVSGKPAQSFCISCLKQHCSCRPTDCFRLNELMCLRALEKRTFAISGGIFLSVSSYLDFSWLNRAVNHFRGSVWGARRQGGDSAAGFPKTAPIIGGTSDFVPRWQMVGWGGFQGGRFTFIVQAHKLYTETIVSARGEVGKKNFPFHRQKNGSGN